MKTNGREGEGRSCVRVRRHCKKCGGKREFVSSGLFRVNANKRKLDVWLVYRCARCGASWNLPIYERVSVGRLSPEEREGFAQNDAALARQYAMDAALLARHGCEVLQGKRGRKRASPRKGGAVMRTMGPRVHHMVADG